MMGHKTKLINFPGEMTVKEFEQLLSDNGLLSAHTKDQYYDNKYPQKQQKPLPYLEAFYYPLVCFFQEPEITEG